METKETVRYDIAIIGTGPAGISAAITARIRNKKVLLLGSSQLSEKVQKAHAIQNYPGLPAVSGAELGAAFQKHLQLLEISVTEDRINAVYAMGDYYALQSATQVYEAEAVILATGVVNGRPYPGEQELLGRGVSYCATCDAPLYKGKTAAVLGFSPKEEEEADFLAELAGQVYYIPMYEGEPHFQQKVTVIREVPEAIIGSDRVEQLKTTGGTYPVDGVFILREAIAPSQLVPGLTTEDNHVKVNRQMETNLPGCFACGDITGLPYQYVKSAGEGNVAALSAVSYLAKKQRNR